MDQVKVKEATANLKAQLENLAGEDDLAAGVLRALTPLFNDIERGKLQAPVSWESVPAGGAFHDESPLRFNEKLCEAYSIFRVEVSGGIPEHLLKIIRSLDNK